MARMPAYKTSSWPNGWNRDTSPEGHFFLTKTTVLRVLITLMRGLEVLCNEVWVVNMGVRDEKLMNSSLFGDVHGCHHCLTMNSALQKGGVEHGFLLLSRYIVNKSQFTP